MAPDSPRGISPEISRSIGCELFALKHHAYENSRDVKVGVIPGVMPVHLSSLVLTVRRRAIGSIIWAADVGGPGDRFAAGP